MEITGTREPLPGQPATLDLTRVGAMMSAFTRQMTTPKVFKVNLSSEEAANQLACFYKMESERRGAVGMVWDPDTCTNIRQVAEYMTTGRRKTGLLFCGQCGNGKTTMMFALGKWLSWLQSKHHFDYLDEDCFRYRDSLDWKIYEVRKVLEIAGKGKEDKRAWPDLKETRLLGIDDMGKEPTDVMDYGNVKSPIVELLEERYEAGRFTVVTTNLTGKEIREKYGERIASRLAQMMEMVVFRNEDYRRNKAV